ncbi:capZ-interacting protein isoform X2 [Sphaeramia orbicularis]|uniref:capZ-interacting protein isoform X2 n=1 Tax=Sphaeramia orbicularis TaxID=375764 RepID=UPI00117DA209|nr:capZ-interacting protein isoform X2 [Sphaeramia orbicularis]
MEDSPSKPSVAELAGRFKGHILPMPTPNNEFRRRPPCSLKLQNQKDDNEESEKAIVPPHPLKVKVKNSPIIEKLQANLALSPTALLPSPKSPEVKLQPAAPLSPTTPCSPCSPLSPLSPLSPRSPVLKPSHPSSEDEDPVSFDSPPEGTTLPSINKTRARLSFKRRPPTRQHRRSAGEEGGALGSALSPCELDSPKENGDGDGDQVFDDPAEEAECRPKEDKDRDCDKTEDGETKDPQEEEKEEEEEEEEGGQNLETLKEEREPSESGPAEENDGSSMKAEDDKEEMPQEEQQEGGERV